MCASVPLVGTPRLTPPPRTGVVSPRIASSSRVDIGSDKSGWSHRSLDREPDEASHSAECLSNDRPERACHTARGTPYRPAEPRVDVQVEPQNSRLEIVSFEYPESG